MEPSIRFADVDGYRVACAVSGTGPALVLPCWWVSDVELQLASSAFRGFVATVGRSATVIRYDRPGTGLSGTRPLPSTLEAERRLLEGVIEQLELGSAAILGASCGGCAAIALAATRPELVDRLLLYGAYADGSAITTPEVRTSLVALVRAHWGLGSAALADVFMPDADKAQRDEFTRFQREVATGEEAAARLQLVYELDVSSFVDRVAVPTLVLHRRGDRTIPFSLGRALAECIPGARFVPLAGRDHFPWIGDVHEMTRHVRAFLRNDELPDGAEGPHTPLSPREREVLSLVAQGLSDPEIAAQLVVSRHTVHRHVANVRRKLGQPSRAAAVAEATRVGLL